MLIEIFLNYMCYSGCISLFVIHFYERYTYIIFFTQNFVLQCMHYYCVNLPVVLCNIYTKVCVSVDAHFTRIFVYNFSVQLIFRFHCRVRLGNLVLIFVGKPSVIITLNLSQQNYIDTIMSTTQMSR